MKRERFIACALAVLLALFTLPAAAHAEGVDEEPALQSQESEISEVEQVEGVDEEPALQSQESETPATEQVEGVEEEPALQTQKLEFPVAAQAEDPEGDDVLQAQETVNYGCESWDDLLKYVNDYDDDLTLMLVEHITAPRNASPVEIPEGMSLTIDLNDFTIDTSRFSSSGSRVWAFNVYGSLTIKDSSSYREGKITGGGGIKVIGGTLVLESGTLADLKNTKTTSLSNAGGAVCVSGGGSFTMTGGSLIDNSANFGGAVCIYNGSFNFTGGIVKGNTAVRNGGAVYVNQGTFTMSGADFNYKYYSRFSENQFNTNAAGDRGGGVYVSPDGTLDLNAMIWGNTATNNGGGVYVAGGSFVARPYASVKWNTNDEGASSNLYLGSDAFVRFKAQDGKNRFTESSAIYYTTQASPTVRKPVCIARDLIWQYSADDFVADQEIENVEVLLVDGSLYLWCKRTWAELQEMINNAKNGDIIDLDSNITAGPNDKSLTIPFGKNVTINMNGCVLNRGLADGSPSEDGSVIVVEGTLTLINTSVWTHPLKPDAVGRITGGNALKGGGIYVDRSGTLIVNDRNNEGLGINIEKNKASQGGGIYSDGTLTVKGGTIFNQNEARFNGGAIYTNYNGTISEPVEVWNNKAGSHGNAIYVGSGSSDLKLTNKFSAHAQGDIVQDLYLGRGRRLKVDGTIKETCELPVSTEETSDVFVFTDGLSGNGTSSSFTSYDAAYQVVPTRNGEAALVKTAAIEALAEVKLQDNHIVGSYDGANNVEFYVNGEKAASGSGRVDLDYAMTQSGNYDVVVYLNDAQVALYGFTYEAPLSPNQPDIPDPDEPTPDDPTPDDPTPENPTPYYPPFNPGWGPMAWHQQVANGIRYLFGSIMQRLTNPMHFGFGGFGRWPFV